MKRIALLALVAICCFSADAQQDPQFTQWMFDRISVNPAVAGVSGDKCLNVFYRDQWDMLERDPKTVMFNYHQRLDALSPNVGAGVTFYSDRLGFETNTVFKLSGAYHYEMPSTGDILSGGIALGYYGKTLGDDWIAKDPNDEAISNNEQSAGTFDLGFGLYYSRPGKFYAGVSSTHLTGQDMSDLNIQIARHYWIMAGGELELSSKMDLRPNVLVKTDGVSTSFDLNANVLFNDLFWVGASYRLQDAISPMAGLQYSGLNPIPSGRNSEYETTLRLGYSYDVTTSELKNYSAGSHEIMLGACFHKVFKPVRKPYTNPRYMGRYM